jgi:hypothetical protein
MRNPGATLFRAPPAAHFRSFSSGRLIAAPPRREDCRFMINLDESTSAPDRTLDTMYFEAKVSGDWSFVEHFMLGNAANALPEAYWDQNQAL